MRIFKKKKVEDLKEGDPRGDCGLAARPSCCPRRGSRSPQPCGRHTCCKSPPTSDLGFDAGPPVGVDDPGAWGWRWRMKTVTSACSQNLVVSRPWPRSAKGEHTTLVAKGGRARHSARASNPRTTWTIASNTACRRSLLITIRCVTVRRGSDRRPVLRRRSSSAGGHHRSSRQTSILPAGPDLHRIVRRP